MKDNAPPGLLGYVIVSLPERGDWQGFYVLPSSKAAGEQMLRDVQEANREAQGAAEASRVLPGTEGADQAAIGAVSGVLAQLFSLGVAVPQPAGEAAQRVMNGVASAAWALVEATGKRWLLVTGRRDPQGRPGFATTIRSYDVETLDEAREAMAADIDRAKRGRAMGDEVMSGMRDLQRRKREG